jgi:hypothetical protein
MKELSKLSNSNAPKLERLEHVLKNCALNVPPSSKAPQDSSNLLLISHLPELLCLLPLAMDQLQLTLFMASALGCFRLLTTMVILEPLFSRLDDVDHP